LPPETAPTACKPASQPQVARLLTRRLLVPRSTIGRHRKSSLPC
jgi:hypothetical protein